MSQSAQPAAFGRGYLESRIATQDGYIWPFERRQMVSPGPISERMVEDIGRLVHDGGEDAVVSEACLIRLGWPAACVAAHASDAFTKFKSSQESRPRLRRVRLAEAALEAAALLLFCTAALLWAGVQTGVV